MPKKVGTCQYEGCERKALPNSENHYCICHEQSGDKDIGKFNGEIEKIMQDKKAKEYNFQGFYFPEKFDFEVIYKHLKNKTFDKEVYFAEATFKDTANFRDTTFQEKADFGDTTFQGHARFGGAKFREEVSFRSAKFQEGVSFEDTAFQEYTEFVETTFQDYTDFLGATFQDYTNFRSAKFQVACFQYAIFQGEADFLEATFQDYTIFRNAIFQEEAYFVDASFLMADIGEAKFEKRANFEKCEIEKKIDFQYAEFHDEFSLTKIKGKPIFDFVGTRFSDKTWIGEETNLENAIFNLSRAELVDFTGANFPKKKKIYEEWLLERHEKLNDEEKDYCPENWENVRVIYRKLKQAHIKYGISDKAEDFGYRERECSRKSKKETKSFGKYFLYTIFKYWLGYGKNPKQLLYSAIFIIFLFSFLYLGTGIEVYNQEDNVYDVFDNCSAPLEKCFYFSVITFTTVGYGDIHPHGDWARGFTMVEASLGVFMMAFFVATFARRFV